MSTLIGATRRRLVMLAAVAATVFALTPATGALAAPAAPQAGGGHAQSHPTKYHPTQSPPTQSHPTQPACPSAKPGYAECQAIRRTDVPGHRGLFTPTAANPTAAPAGYGPADLQSAYNLPSATAGNGATVAVVDAFDDPTAEADLAVYRQQYGLPACTTANGCFRKVAQDGSTTYPMVDSDWGVEISLDLDMVSATCPNCHILLVEANDNSIANLGAAENEAVALGAKYVSNSWAGPEDPSETAWDTAYFDHPGVAITAAAGDNGYGVSYPSASPYVTAVGGTTLLRDANTPRGWEETAWGGTGSGCSQYEPKPAWQTDSGCANRTIADVSADADAENSPVAVYDSSPNPDLSGGWGAVGGTSAATPIIAATYALAGTPFNGGNPASYPYANPSALNDVTSGSNGNCSVDYLCDAGTGYDGPTGLGTPDGTAAFTEKHGDITGTITDAATGQPLAGAIVQSGSATTTTGSDGHYDLSLAADSYDLTVMDLSGYATQAVSGVQVTDGSTVTESVALRPAANVTLSGTVTDGSGQGWPLYAKVSLPGTPVSAYSDPVTGKYTLSVPQGGAYTLRVDPVYAGYQQAHQSVTVGTSSLTQDLSVPVNGAACTAPGYQLSTPTTLETFDQQTIPPGWSVVNNGDPANTWAFNDPNGIPNVTGYSGNFAAVYPTANDGTDTELISPVINMTGNAYPVLEFDSGNNWVGAFQDTVEVSTDGGKTWNTAWTSNGITGPVSVPLPQAADQASVQVAFRGTVPPQSLFYGDIQWWEVADVALSGCGPTPGGLVVGRVADANTGQGVDDATVTSADQSGQSGTSSAAGDPGLGGGFYSLFSSLSGSHPFTASAPSYTPATSTVNVVTGQVTRADFTLDAGRLAVTPASVTATGKMSGAATTATVTIANTGTAPATLGASSQPGGFTVLGQRAATTRGTPAVRSVPIQRVRGQFSPHVSKSAQAAAQPAAAVPAGAQWVTTAGYPDQTADVATATDPATGKVYTAGGLLNGSLKCDAATSGYVLDPATGAWTSLPAMPHARAGAEAAFIGGKLYVTGGYGIACTAVPGLDIYNPATGKWTSGAAIPNPYYGSGSAVVGGKMYVVGGCDPGYGVCGMTNVQVYNPASNTWTTAAPYPAQTAWLGCGGIGGKLYCAGGVSDYSGSTSAGYVYDPATNAWSEIASLPIDLWGGADAVANGQLLISGGVTSNSTVVTNQGYAYDPATGTWTALPNAPTATYEAAGACGFYRIGGFGPNLVANVDQLPGYGDCGGDPWLSASPATATLQPGQSTKVTVTLNAADPSISQPGTYTAALRFGSDTPYGATTIPVQFTVNPPSTWGGIAGTVSGRACNGTTAPLPGATVQVTGAHGSWVLGADAGGQYSLWLDTTNNPLTVIVSATGWKPQAATVTLTKQSTTTRNFTLTPTASCT